MKLLLMRHADKDDANGILDIKKPLSEIGKGKAINIGAIIKKELDGEMIDLILSSPAIHAIETGNLIRHFLGLPGEVKKEESLSPGRETSQIWMKLNNCDKRVILLIGHDPQITNLIKKLSGIKVILDRAGVCCINVNDIGKENNPILWVKNPYYEDHILQLDYETTNDYFRQLSEIRFKLLAFVPLVSGTAIGLLTLNDKGQNTNLEGALLLGLFGFLVTLGVIFYELRNSQFYDIAVCRAKNIEKLLKMPLNGLFNQRPNHEKGPKIFGVLTVWHDRGLALIYGTTLAGWSYLISYSLFLLLNKSNALAISFGVAFVILVVSLYEFNRIEKNRLSNGSGENCR